MTGVIIMIPKQVRPSRISIRQFKALNIHDLRNRQAVFGTDFIQKTCFLSGYWADSPVQAPLTML